MNSGVTTCGDAGSHRRGYTLIEVLVSTAITAVVMSQLVTVLIASQRVVEQTMADVELSIRTHELREKLFYNVDGSGGLMDACVSELEFAKKSGGDAVTFKPKKGKKNKVKVGDNKRLTADYEKKSQWLACGTMIFQGTNVFVDASTGGVIQVNLNVAIPIKSRVYAQRHQMQTQIMNEE